MRRSEVERVARELFDAAHGIKRDADGNGVDGHGLSWEAAAEYVLREVRRARGRTVGHVFLTRECDESGEDCWFEIKGGMLDGPINVRMSQMIHDEVARVVLVPRKRRPK